MRLLALLLMGLIPELATCQSPGRPDQPHPYDTLQKYSYLIVVLKSDRRRHKHIPIADGTGFFIRQDEKLYLISARHVFTNCDPYSLKKRDDKPDAIKVWYQDTLGQPKYQVFSLPESKLHDTCKPDYVVFDVDTMDVTGYFTDARINSVERLKPDYEKPFYTLSPGDTVVAYGYSQEPNRDSIDILPNMIPERYIAYGRDMPNDQSNYINGQYFFSYYAIEPGLPHGVSGAPIFWIGREEGKAVVEFSGIQSSTRVDGNVSHIVQGRMLSFCFHMK